MNWPPTSVCHASSPDFISMAWKRPRDVPTNAVRISFAVRVEVEGASKPALLANVNYLYYPV